MIIIVGVSQRWRLRNIIMIVLCGVCSVEYNGQFLFLPVQNLNGGQHYTLYQYILCVECGI